VAASDPTFGVATPTGVLEGVAAFGWDGSQWQPSGRVAYGVGTPTGVLRGVAPFSWSGSAWTPAGRAGPSVATPSGVLQGVAVYTWNGSAWTPAGGGPGSATPSGVLRGVAAFSWDGTQWQPAGQAGPDVATPFGVLQGVAMFNWSGSAWSPAGGLPAGATADLLFMTPGTLPPNVVFTRASTATYFDASGALQTAATNAPRWDYDPLTLALRGMLKESARTNLLLNSAVLGTQSATVTAAATTLSFYGTGTVTMSGAFVGTLVGAGAFPQRASVTFTPTAGTLTLTVTGSVLNAQLEAGAYASSYVPTVGASVTRAAEQCALTDAVLFGGATDRTIAVRAYARQAAVINGYWASLNDGGNTNFMTLITVAATSNIRPQVQVASVIKVNAGDLTCGVPPTLFKAAVANGATWNGAVNGAPMPTTGGVSQQLGPLTVLRIGEGQLGTGQPDGWMQRLLYWPRALSLAELQSVTT
jgi:hypothetical protein